MQPHTHLEVPPLGLFGSSQHPANSRRVSGHRLFHEDVFALADGFLEVDGPKPGRAGQNHHICQRDGFLVTIKIRELMLRGNRYLVLMFAFERVQALLQLLGPHIGQGDQLGGAGGAQRLAGGAGAAPAAGPPAQS